jgi:hypothetical protein
MNKFEFKPRVAPRDLSDALISILIGSFQVLLLFVLPGFLCHSLTDNVPLAVLFSFGLYGFYVLFAVTKLEVSTGGLRFVRLLGSPKLLQWSEISSVSEASRQELIIHGWLWPLFPSREFTPSCTSLGHYRITYGNKFVYFPPLDADAFKRALPLAVVIQ